MEQTHTDSSPPPKAGAGRPQRFLTGRVLRVVVWLTTIQVALQPVFAGMFLDGNPTGLTLHSINGSLVELTALILLITSILAWRPGRAPGRVAVAGSLMFVVIYLQAMVGYVRALNVHVPLGVATLVLMIWLLVSTRGLQPVPRGKK